MSNALVPVFAGEIAGTSVQLVNARLLHGFLESAQHFADWIKNRIADYGFVQDQDFLVSQFYETKKGRGGNRKPVIDYHLSIDMAKELAMVERTDKGREVRRYFIECERRALTGLPNALRDLRSKKALPGGLTLDQQDAIKALVRSRVEALPKERQGGAAITCWSALKTKFGCTYKAIAPELFTEALSLVARLDLLGQPALPAPEPVELPRYSFPLSNWKPGTRIGATAWFTFQEWVRLREQGSSQLAELIYTLGRDGHDVSGPQTEFRGLCHMVESMHMQWESMRYMFDKMEGRGLRIQLQPASA